MPDERIAMVDTIISDVRGFLNLDKWDKVFDSEITPHIMAAISTLAQNGVCKTCPLVEGTTWNTIIDPLYVDNCDVHSLVPLFVMMRVKILFDPPPPSTIQYYQNYIDECLWRLRIISDTKGGD